MWSIPRACSHIIGAGKPALPGVSIDRNGKVAFGLPLFSIDQEDLYVCEINPADPQRYRCKEGWENFRVVREGMLQAGSGASFTSAILPIR